MTREPDQFDWQPDDDTQMPTLVDGQEGGQIPPTQMPDVPFQPTSPPEYQTPSDAFAPPHQAPYAQPPAQTAGTGDKTQIMGVPREKLPLAWLSVVDSSDDSLYGETCRMQRETTVGRTTGQLVLAHDAAVSGQHIKIRLEASEDEQDTQIYVLYDLASSNGTFVGDFESCRDQANRIYRHVLRDGDFVMIGRTVLVFKQVQLG